MVIADVVGPGGALSNCWTTNGTWTLTYYFGTPPGQMIYRYTNPSGWIIEAVFAPTCSGTHSECVIVETRSPALSLASRWICWDNGKSGVTDYVDCIITAPFCDCVASLDATATIRRTR